MWYRACGWTTERADHALPSTPGWMAITLVRSVEGPQKRQAWERGVGSLTSSPVITQERVMGSLRSSMAVRRAKSTRGVKWRILQFGNLKTFRQAKVVSGSGA